MSWDDFGEFIGFLVVLVIVVGIIAFGFWIIDISYPYLKHVTPSQEKHGL